MIRSLVFFLALNTLSVYLVAQLLDTFVITGGPWGFAVVGCIVGLLNLFVKPILKVLSLPVIFLTAGLFVVVINAAILWLAQYVVMTLAIPDITFAIGGAITYIIAALLLGVFNYLFQKLT